MKSLSYTTIATEQHSIQVSTWQEQRSEPFGSYEWHYKFMINGKVTDEGLLPDEDEPVQTTEAEDHVPVAKIALDEAF